MEEQCCKMSCRHYPFRGQHVDCKTCPEVTVQDTGKKCAKCGKSIILSKRQIPLQYMCILCSEKARPLDFGMATEANLRYCYYIATSEVLLYDDAMYIADTAFDKMDEKHRKQYLTAVEGWRKVRRLHEGCAAGSMWLKRAEDMRV